MRALTVNTGSTSVKLALWEDARRAGTVRWDVPADADRLLREWVGDRPPAAVVHRVVHGGARSEAVAIDAAVLDEVRALIPLAPNHNPRAVEWIEACARVWPGARQVAAFDTAFFARLPVIARTYALPRELTKKHALRRYGFHGLAHASMWRAWCANAKNERARIVTLQLGGGCSAAAIDGGAPLETSMGLTPLEGLVMATRAGDVDAGLLVHLTRAERLDPDALEELLAKRSGLLGVSGLSGDLRDLAAAPDDPDVRLAIDVFVHRVRKYIGAYAAVLGGLDGVVMGGGVSEHWPDVRARILAGFEWLGLSIDDAKNRAARAVTAPIHREGSRVEVWVAAIDEERELLSCVEPL